jgi:hypothetical protein
MKKTIFLITGLFISLYTMGQSPTSDVFNATAPKGAKKLTREQLTNYVHSNYKRSGLPLDKENTYQVDGLLISYWSLSVNPDFKKSLKSTQSEMLAVLKENNNMINDSRIIKINNIQFLVYEYQKENEVTLRFQSEFNKNNKNINGIIQFKEADKDKAHKALDDFLQTVHFKE